MDLNSITTWNNLFDFENIFFKSKDLEISGQDFFMEILEFSNHLKELPQRNIALLFKDNHLFLKTLFSCFLANKKVTPLFYKSPHEDHFSKIAMTDSTLVISDGEVLSGEEVKIVDTSTFKKTKKEDIQHQIDLNATALFVFTSGSTSGPKPIELTFKNLLTSALGSNQFYEFNESDNYLLSLPLHHVGGLLIIFRCLLAKATILNSAPSSIYDDIVLYRPNYISMVSAQLKSCLSKDNVTNCLIGSKGIILGGAPTPITLIREATKKGISLANSYGMTETSAQCLSTPLTTNPTILSTVGTPLPYREVTIQDGKLSIRGDIVAKGIYKGETFNGKISTNDLAKIDNQQNITILGRADNIFISGGENINPLELEETIRSLPGIESCLITNIEDPKFGQIPFCFYKGDLSENGINDRLKDRLNPYLIPKFYHRVGASDLFELNQTIKLSRSKFKDLADRVSKIHQHDFSVLTFGNPSNHPVVLLHGFMGKKEDWLPLCQQLSKDNFVISIDLPGHGKTSMDDFSSRKEFDYKISNLLDIFKSKVTLIGYSQGGRIATDLYLKNPNKFNKLILESSSLGISRDDLRDKRFDWDRSLLHNIENQDQLNDFLDDWYQMPLFGKLKEHKNYHNLLKEKKIENVKGWHESLQLFSVGLQKDYRNLLNQTHQIFYIYGEYDTKYKAMGLEFNRLTNCRLYEIKGASHNTHFEKSSKFIEIIKDCLK